MRALQRKAMARFVCRCSCSYVLVTGLILPHVRWHKRWCLVLQALSGGGGIAASPTLYIPFINYALCWIISGFYGVAPEIPCWTLLHLVAIFVSVAAANWVSFALRPLCERGVCSKFAILVVLDFGLFSYFPVRLQFTTTASLLMAAVILLSCGMGQRETRRGIRVRVVPAAEGHQDSMWHTCLAARWLAGRLSQ